MAESPRDESMMARPPSIGETWSGGIQERPVCRAIVLAALTICMAVCARAGQDVVEGFTGRTFTAANGETMPYRLFIPDAGARKDRLPLVLYLHGGGGVGTDNRKQISGGNTNGTHTWTTPEAQRRHPAFVLAPQLRENRPSQPGRADAWAPSLEAVLELVAAVSRRSSPSTPTAST